MRTVADPAARANSESRASSRRAQANARTRRFGTPLRRGLDHRRRPGMGGCRSCRRSW